MQTLASITIKLTKQAAAILNADDEIRKDVHDWATDAALNWKPGTIACGRTGPVRSWQMAPHATKPGHFTVSVHIFPPDQPFAEL